MKAENRKKIIKALLFLIVLGLVFAYLRGSFREKIEPGTVKAPRRVRSDQPVVPVYKVMQTQQVEIVGTVRARQRTEVSSRIMAAIIEMKVQAGNTVKKGQVLFRLDSRDLTARAMQASQEVVSAKVNAANAEKNYLRFKKLREGNVASEQEYDNALARYESARAQLKQAEQAFNAAQTMLSYAVIRAPVSGIVVDRNMDVGDIIHPGEPVLTIYDPAELRLEAAVPEALAVNLKKGATVRMAIDTIESTRINPIKGTVDEIVPQADAASRSVLVKVQIPEGIPDLIEGMTGRLYVPAKERVRLCVASSAVVEIGQLRYVDVVDSNGDLERRMIKLGERSPYGRVEVLSGVYAGERVVLYGPPPDPLPEGVRLFGEE
jgi:membrane fusion protein (multidrug efflux system)